MTDPIGPLLSSGFVIGLWESRTGARLVYEELRSRVLMVRGSDEGGSQVAVRRATPADAQAIARLHADSWRRHYRGAYLDSFLDGEVFDERLEVWSDRLGRASANTETIVAESGGEIVGFAHVVFGDDPEWGALVENLHVRVDQKRRGIGARLLRECARVVLVSEPPTGLYLWVLGQNVAAQAFYEAQGGVRVESAMRGPFPGGGTAPGFRYSWRDPSVLLRQRGRTGR